jgi:formylmethanofuran dehydrogenase subunit E
MPSKPPKAEPKPENEPLSGPCDKCGEFTTVTEASLPMGTEGTYCAPCVTRAWNEWERW